MKIIAKYRIKQNPIIELSSRSRKGGGLGRVKKYPIAPSKIQNISLITKDFKPIVGSE